MICQIETSFNINSCKGTLNNIIENEKRRGEKKEKESMNVHTKANVFVGGRIILSKPPNLLNILDNSISEEPYGKFFTNRTWLLLFTPSTFPAAYSSKDATFTPAFVRAFLVSAIT